MSHRVVTATLAALVALAGSPGVAQSAVDDPAVKVDLVSSGRGVALLNEQRNASGIPGDLSEDAELSQGCREWATYYQPKDGQYAHDELPGQPGYTVLGDKAASSSDLAGRATMGSGSGKTGLAWWTSKFNPWSDAPLHLSQLLDPAATSTWYGESHVAGCMGTNWYARAFSAPTFYSVPANGATNQPVSQHAVESPWVPQQVAGIPASARTGTNIIVYPEGLSSPALIAASMSDTSGGSVPVAVVSPTDPEPAPDDPSFPTGFKVGDYSRSAGFVIPRSPLTANHTYSVTATWRDSAAATYVQTLSFTTGALTLEQMMPSLGSSGSRGPGATGVKLRLSKSRTRFSHGAFRYSVIFKSSVRARLTARIRGRSIASRSSGTLLRARFRVRQNHSVKVVVSARTADGRTGSQTWRFYG